jgi:nitrite reductase/ring-hydroxylating ferredoxin subunit
VPQRKCAVTIVGDMIPVSLSGGVEPGARTGTSVNGRPVVVWRGQDGAARAWADQCPHRGMRLSFGFVRENALACIYHGWWFSAGPAGAAAGAPDGAGQCLVVPAHPGITPPAKATIPAFPVAEVLGMIWVGDGPEDKQPPRDPLAPPADLPGTLPGTPSGALRPALAVYPVRSITVPAPAAALRAALEAAQPPGTETVETSDPPGPGPDQPTGGIITFKGRSALVIAAIQDRGDGASSAHVVTTDAGLAARKALCQWAALVRDHLAAVVLP